MVLLLDIIDVQLTESKKRDIDLSVFLDLKSGHDPENHWIVVKCISVYIICCE